jgi:hypothetical protein
MKFLRVITDKLIPPSKILSKESNLYKQCPSINLIVNYFRTDLLAVIIEED